MAYDREVAEFFGDYNAQQQDDEKLRMMQADNALLGASDKSPDDYAEAMRHEQNTGVPSAVGVNALPDLRLNEQRRNNQVKLMENQTLASILAENPNIPLVAHDDMDALDRVTKIWDGTVGKAQHAATGWETGSAQSEYNDLQFKVLSGGTLNEEEQKRLQYLEPFSGKQTTGFIEPAFNLLGQMGGYAKYVGPPTIAAAAAAGLTGSFIGGPLVAKEAMKSAGGAMMSLKSFEYSYRQEAGGAYAELSKLKDDDGNPIDQNIVKTASYLIGAANGAVEAGGIEILSKPFKKFASKQLLSDMKDILVSPTKRKVFLGVLKQYGINVGTEVGTENVQEIISMMGEYFTKSNVGGPSGADAALRLAGAAVNSGVLPTPVSIGIEAAKIGKEILDNSEWADFSLDEAITRLAGITSEVGRGMALLGVPGASINIKGELRAVREAEQNRATIEALAEGSPDSKLLQRSSTLFQAVVQKASERDGGLKNIYIPADRFVEYFQGKDSAEMQQVVAAMPSVREQLDAAIASGGDLVIPAGEFATYLAPNHGKGLVGDIRLGFKQATLREVDEFRQNFPDQYKALVSIAEEEGKAVSANQDAYDTIQKQVFDQLMQTEKYSDSQAQIMAEQFSRSMVHLATREGIDPLAEFQKVAPTIVSDIFTPQEGDALNQSTYHATPHVWQPEPGFPHGRPRLDRVSSGVGPSANGWGWNSAQNEAEAANYQDAFNNQRGQSADLLRLDIPDEAIPLIIDFESDINAQTGEVKAALQNIKNIDGYDKFEHLAVASLLGEHPRSNSYVPTGRDIYNDLSTILGSDKSASEYLTSIGIVGSRTVDRISYHEDTANQTHNYVIWDQGVLDRIALLERNGKKLDAMRELYQSQNVTAEQDAAYLSAVKRGDMETAQKMVDEARASLPFKVKPPKRLYRGVATNIRDDGLDGLGTFALGRGLYSSPDKTFAKKYGPVHEVSAEDGYPRNPLIMRNAAGGAPQAFADWLLRESGLRNIREFNKKYPDPGVFVRSKGYDGVVAGDEVVRYTADPVTYDDKGDIIPLSERFGTSDYIRYQGEAAPRGSFNQTTNVIKLFESANLTTFLHESGHYYLNFIKTLAMREGATEQLKKDWQVISEWLGVRGDTITREQHEMFADGFLTYLYEGKAPTPKLATAFARFRAWLVTLYQSFTQVNLSDDVRNVFDRMMASDDEIKAVERESNFQQLWKTAEEAGFTEAEFAAYKELAQESRAKAEADLTAKLMSQMKREQESVWRKMVADRADRIRKSLGERKDYRAAAILRNGRLADGTEVPPELQIKLSSKQLKENYPDAYKRLSFLHRKEGVDLGVAAELLGFGSADEMVESLRLLPNLKEEAFKQAETELRKEYGDLRETGEIKVAAVDALHNELRGSLLMAEFRSLAAKTGEQARPDQAFRDAARRIIAERKAQDIHPEMYRRAEDKANREALKATAEKNYEAAYASKQRQILNHHLYMEARQARKEADKLGEHMRSLAKEPAQKRLARAGGGYLDQINELLNRFEFKKVSFKQLDRRQSFAEFVMQHETDDDLAVPVWVLDENIRTNYMQLTMTQLRELDEVVRHIEHVASIKNKLLDIQGKRDIETAENEMVASAEEHMKLGKKPPLDPNMISKWEKFTGGLKGFDATMMRVEQIIDWLDGGKADGPWARYFWNLFSDAQNKENDLSIKYLKGLARSIAQYGKKFDLMQKVRINSLGEDVSRAWLITVVLNLGNDSNRQKLVNGYKWDATTVAEIADKLTKEDWDFVQGIWDQINDLWPDIVELEKKVRGVPPEKISATPIQTKYGEYKGGYYPVVYDHTRSIAGMRQQDEQTKALYEASLLRATTPKGYIQKRIDDFSAPIRLGDLNVIPNHLSAVIHDLTHRTAIINAKRLLSRTAVREIIQRTLGQAYYDMMGVWVDNIANDRVLRGNDGLQWWMRWAQALRMNTTVVAMGLKATTMLSQLAGFSNSLDVVGAGSLSVAAKDFALHPLKTTEWVFEKSGEMRHRIEQRDRDIKEALRQLQGKTDTLSRVRDFSLVGIGYFDLGVSIPTWVAAYREALVKYNGNEDTAVRAADRAVRLSQGAGGAKDMARVMSNSNMFMRTITMFYSYFSALYSRLRNMGHLSSTGHDSFMRTVSRAFFLIVAPALLSEILSGRWPDEDEGQELAPWMIYNLATYPFATLPGLRDISNYAAGKITGERNYGYAFTPMAKALEVMANGFIAPAQALQGEIEWDDAAKKMFAASGYIIGLPTAQAKITLGYWLELLTDERDAKNMQDFITRSLYYRRD